MSELAAYQPHPKQIAFHQARRTYRRRWFAGGRQSGKTQAGAVEAALYALKFRRGGEGAIFAPSYPHAIVARHRFEAMVPPKWRTYNGTDRLWSLEGGARVHLRSLSDADAPRGLTLDWAWLDECAMYDEEAWQNVRATLAVKRAAVWGTSTPRGMNWLWRQAVQAPEPGVDYLIHSLSIDNPLFPPNEWNAIRDRYGADSPFFRQEYEGKFEAFVGQAFPQFSRTIHVQRVGPNANWTWWHGWDFGWHPAPTVWIPAQIDGDRRVILRGCKTWTETPRPLVLSEARAAVHGNEITPGRGVCAIDPSGAQGRARESGDRGWQQDMEMRGWEVTWTRRTGEAAGLNQMRMLLHQGRLLIDSSAPGAQDLIHAFETAESSKNPEKDELADQHPQADIIDAVRYIVVSALPMDKPVSVSKM